VRSEGLGQFYLGRYVLFFYLIKERSYSLDLEMLPNTDKEKSDRRGSKKEVKTF
jgi:hypothetical protein